MSSEKHNVALPDLLRIIVDHANTESEKWVILESLCLGIGMLHQRTPRQTAEFVEALAERLTSGARA